MPAEGVGGVLAATAIALGSAAALFTHDWDGLFAPLCLMPVVPPTGAGRRDVATHTALVYRDKFLTITAITSSIISLLFALSWSNILDRFARRIRKPRYTDGRILALLADTMGTVSRRMNWSNGISDTDCFAEKFVAAVQRRRDGRKSGFLRPPNFNPTANAADRTYKKHLKLLNTMVMLFAEGPQSALDFRYLKVRVKHFLESARLQRTGRESDSEDEDDSDVPAPAPVDDSNGSSDGAPAPAPIDDDDDGVPEIPGTTI